MCVAVAAITATQALVATSVATTAASLAAQSEQAAAQTKAAEAQQAERQTEAEQQAGQQASKEAQAARAAGAASIVGAASSGINLGSNSLLGSLQTTTENETDEQGLITQNLNNERLGIQVETQSNLNSKAYSPTFLGAATDLSLSGAAAYEKGVAAKNRSTPYYQDQ